MRYLPALAALALAGCGQLEPRVTLDAAVSLATAESAFAAHSVREDMRAAFLANFDTDGVFVREGWVNANAFLTPRAAPPIVLDWRPVYAEAAASGEMGLSTGPWALASKDKPDAPASFGQFVSVWRRAPGGPWKVAVDLGIAHPQAELIAAPLEVRLSQGAAARGGASLEAVEQRFADEARANGLRAAYAKYASPRLRFYRDGAAPVVGLQAAMASAAMGNDRSDGQLAWKIERSETARSNDFGYARGAYAAQSAPQRPLGWFLRVWRVEEGEWRIALDVVNPAPR
jgi:ketosteroid isomerase-like protein